MRIILPLFLSCTLSFGFPAKVPLTKQSKLKIGIAASQLLVPHGTPLAGYPHIERTRIPVLKTLVNLGGWFTPTYEENDPIRAKAMVFQNPTQKMVWISLDVLAVSSSFRQKVAETLKPLGFFSHEILLLATHTHSGPGGFEKNSLSEITVSGSYRPAIEKSILTGIFEAVKAAKAKSQPAHLLYVTFPISGIQENRLVKGGMVDAIARVFLAQATNGEYLGSAINLGVHATAYGGEHLRYSADLPGGIEREMERMLLGFNQSKTAKPTCLFINGISGDVLPTENGSFGIEDLGHKFAEQALANSGLFEVLPTQWKIKNRKINLPPPKYRFANCRKGKFLKTFFSRFQVPLKRWFPSTTLIQQIQWGKLRIATLPGEPTTHTGYEIQRVLSPNPSRDVAIFATSDDYLGYFPTPEEFSGGSIEACFAFYGQSMGGLLASEHQKIK